jgi:hypothetical protein
MNGWFPSLNVNNDIISGNNGIWVTPFQSLSTQISPAGTTPCWSGTVPVWNYNDGTTRYGSSHIAKAYNEYEGSSIDQFAGFTSDGTFDVYNHGVFSVQVQGCVPRFSDVLGYLYPYQNSYRQLVVNGITIHEGVITNFVLLDHWSVWVEYVGNVPQLYTSYDGTLTNITIEKSENPQFAFYSPDGTGWVVTNTSLGGGVVFVRPLIGYMGYVITGELFYPDGKMINNQLYVVGSSSNGTLRDGWIDFSQPRVDLRDYNPANPPEPIPPEPIPPEPQPEPKPPEPTPPPIQSDYYEVKVYGS